MIFNLVVPAQYRFNVECLKVAVLKNRWLADKLGGEMYAVVFRYETAPLLDKEKEKKKKKRKDDKKDDN
jgi:hypothetical protein